MRLVEEGQLNLDHPIDHYAPNFTIQSRFADGEPATIRHILAHRSGLPRNYCVQKSEWHMGSDATSRMAYTFENCFLVYPVGTRYKYSNAGFDTLGYIIQEQRGQIFPPYMVEELLVPIGMSNSTFWSSDLADKALLATGYEHFDGDYFPYEQYDIVQIPSGNLYGTVADLAEFVRFIFREGANGEQLIGPEMLDMMFEDQFSTPSDPQTMGLGWKINTVLDSIKMVWHDGRPTEGIGSLVTMLPGENLGVVLLANSTSFDGAVSGPLAAELVGVMLETETGAVDTSLDSRELIPSEAVKLEKYHGAYAAFGQIMEVYVDDDRLKGSIVGMSFDLVPVAEDHFVASHWLLKLGLADLLRLPLDLQELEMEFLVEPEGRIRLL